MKWFRISNKSRRLQTVAAAPSNDHKFDEQTGQIYTETTAAVTNDIDRDWPYRLCTALHWTDTEIPRGDDIAGTAGIIRDVIQKMKKSDRLFKAKKFAFISAFRGTKVKGTRSLADVALETIILNITDLNVEVLDQVPIRLLELIWDHIMQRLVY